MRLRFRLPVRAINPFLIALFLMTGCAPGNLTPANIDETPTEMAAVTSTTTSNPPTSTLPASQQPATVPATKDVVSTLTAGQWAQLFYHERLKQVILINGGPEKGKPADDPLELWSWDGARWSLIAADINGPTWRNWAAVAYDPTRDVLIVHGGLQSASNRFDETWEWDGTQWTQFTLPGPGVREGSLMAYDAARSQTLLFGGAVDLEIKGDTWAWDGVQWTLLSETGPAPRFPGGMAFDPGRQELLVTSGHFAGTSGSFIDYGDLWAWNGFEWRELTWTGESPGHRTHTVLVYDSQTENILLFGGGIQTFIGDIWSWNGTNWTMIPTVDMPARSGHSVAYDEARDIFVFFGGVDRPAVPASSDTWEWDRTTWICKENCP